MARQVQSSPASCAAARSTRVAAMSILCRRSVSVVAGDDVKRTLQTATVGSAVGQRADYLCN
jgi:hypothetical protein